MINNASFIDNEKFSFLLRAMLKDLSVFIRYLGSKVRPRICGKADMLLQVNLRAYLACENVKTIISKHSKDETGLR